MKNLHRQLSRDVSCLNNKFKRYCLNACIKDKKVINFSPGPTQIPVLDLLYEKQVYSFIPY